MPLYVLTYSELGTDFQNFTLSVSSGTITPTTVTRTQLLSGVTVECNDGVTITVTSSGGPCSSSQNIATPGLPGPTYFYFSLQQCSGPGSITGRSITNYAIGTVFNILGTCYTINTAMGTATVSYDYDLDIYDEVPAGCSDPACTGGGGGGSTTCDCYTVMGSFGSITVTYVDCATSSTVTNTFNPGEIFSVLPGNSVEIVSSSGPSLSSPVGCVI